MPLPGEQLLFVYQPRRARVTTQVALGRPLLGTGKPAGGPLGTARGLGLIFPWLWGGVAMGALIGSLSWAESRKHPL